MTRRRKLTFLTTSVAALVTATALAAPDRTGSLSVGGTYNWDGGPISGAAATSDLGDSIPCGPGKECDDTLIKTAEGQVTVKISSEDSNSADLDLYAYRSDDSGTPGTFVKSSTGPDANETVTFEADNRPYLIRVVPATAVQGTFKGESKELALPPRPPDVGGGNFGTDPTLPGGGSGNPTTRANDLAPTTTAKPPKNSQSRVLTGTAADRDGKIAYVDVALVRVNKRSCTALRPDGKFRAIRKCKAPPFLRAKGTTKWRLTLSKPLAKGRYVVFARATDDLGRTEGGFGKRNRVRFRIT